MSAIVEVGVRARWDALALSERLNPYHAYLVQLGPERWLVRAEAPGYNGEAVQAALTVIGECLVERGVNDAAVRINGQSYRSSDGVTERSESGCTS